MSRALPATPPNANDKINSTGYSLFDILLIDALRPIIKLASPKPVKSTSLYFSAYPFVQTGSHYGAYHNGTSIYNGS